MQSLDNDFEQGVNGINVDLYSDFMGCIFRLTYFIYTIHNN